MADTLDILSLDEAKRALNIATADTTFDTELAAYITAVSQRIDDMCGPVVQRTVTGEVHNGGSLIIWPTLTPVVSVTSLAEYTGGVATTLTAETAAAAGTYLLAGAGTHNSQLRRRRSWNDTGFASGRSNVVITYVAGRYANTAAVSAKFKQAAAKTLAWLWRGDQGAGTATFGAVDGSSLFGLGFALPNSVVELLAYEQRGPMVA